MEEKDVERELKEIKKQNETLLGEISNIKQEITSLKKIKDDIQARYDDLLRKEESFLNDVNDQIEREIFVVVLGTIKKYVNKEMVALRLLRRRIRAQVRHQVKRETDKEVRNLLPGIKKEMQKIALDILNQLKRQTGKQLEKEVQEQVKETAQILIEKMEDSELKAITDGLTGAFNRRYFETRIEQELKLAKRVQNPLSLIMFDIDHFKDVNDTYGHQTGDLVLQEIVTVVKNTISSTDFIFRYGGEEFAVIMQETPLDGAFTIAENMRKAVQEHTFYGGEKIINVTISLGVAEYPANAIIKHVLIEKADEALYLAKQSGRNNTKPANK